MKLIASVLFVCSVSCLQEKRQDPTVIFDKATLQLSTQKGFYFDSVQVSHNWNSYEVGFRLHDSSTQVVQLLGKLHERWPQFNQQKFDTTDFNIYIELRSQDHKKYTAVFLYINREHMNQQSVTIDRLVR